jgi:hypothetical protein
MDKRMVEMEERVETRRLKEKIETENKRVKEYWITTVISGSASLIALFAALFAIYVSQNPK